MLTRDGGSADAAERPSEAEVAAVARGGLANLVGAGVSAVANFAFVFVIARFVDRIPGGLFISVTSMFLIGEQMLRLGADTGAIYFIARWCELGEAERIRPALRAAFAPVIGTALVATAIFEILAPSLAHLIDGATPTTVVQIRILAALIPIVVAYDVVLGATRGFRSMRASVLLEKIVRPVVQVTLVALVLAIGWDDGLAPAWALPYVLVAVAAAMALRKMYVELPRNVVKARQIAREFWSFSLPRAVAGAAQIILQRLDIVLVGAMRGPVEALVYTAASRFLVLGQFLSQGIAAPVQPRLSAALSAGNRALGRGLYRLSTTWIVLVGWPVFLLAGAFAPEYMALFGGDYSTSPAITVVIVLAGSMLVATGVGIVDSVIIMAGRTSWNLWTTLLAVVVNVLVDVLLIPPYGIVGAAIGWSAAILASNLVPLLIAWTRLGMHPFGRVTAEIAVLSLMAFAVLPAVGRALGGVTGAIVGAVMGVGSYAVVVWLRREEYDLTGLIRRRPRRPVIDDPPVVV